MPHGATSSTVLTYRAHAARLRLYADAMDEGSDRAEFTVLAHEWERMAALAEWQVAASQ
jgi:hypothetical protein